MPVAAELSTVFTDVPIKRDLYLVAPQAPDLKDRYSLYREHGGILPSARYEKFSAICDSFQEDKFIPSEYYDASSMAKLAGFELTPKEIFVYECLRKTKYSGEEWSARDVYDLGDHELLAEIMLLQGKLNEHRKLASTYIF